MNRGKAAFRVAAMMAACARLGVPLAHAQESDYGSATTANYVLQAYAFEPGAGDGANLIGNNFASRSCSSSCDVRAPVMLPAGAVIVGMELEACDTNPAASVAAELSFQPQLEGGISVLASVSTGNAATPGCAFFSVNLAAAHTVNNETGSYCVVVSTNGTTVATRFQAVRLVYRLQVSAAPATATFPNDVPASHPFFRFVEALAAAGISGGCSAGSFCPNDPVTRGQMAVFLATALGLHFPN
jgi:S-layer family protein